MAFIPFHTRRASIELGQHGASLGTVLHSSFMLASLFCDDVAETGDRLLHRRPSTVTVAHRLFGGSAVSSARLVVQNHGLHHPALLCVT